MQMTTTAGPETGRGIRMVAIAAAAIFTGVAAFQIAMALGAPWGALASGGGHEGQLSPVLRIGSGIAGGSLLWMALVVLARGGVTMPITPVPARRLKAFTWTIAGFMVFNTVANLASQSSSEQLLFAPITALLAVLTVLVAARGTTPAA